MMKFSKQQIILVNCFMWTLVLMIAQQAHGQIQLLKKDTSEIRFINSRKFFVYKVTKGETLFSIAQKFKIPQQEILDFNKDISEQGLKNRSKIWIPAYSWLKNEITPAKNEVEEIDKHPEKNFYKVTIVTTLNLPKLYYSYNSGQDSSFVDEPIDKDISNNLAFVEGALQSADRLNSEGLKIHIDILDSEQDTSRTLSKIKNLSPDIIITNESGMLLKFLARYSDKKKIKLLSAGINTTDYIKDSQNTFCIFPSSLTQCEEMGRFSARYFPNSVATTIKSIQPKENERSQYFRNGWKNSGGGKSIIIDYNKGGVKAIIDSLSTTKKNVIFLSSSNEDIITTILSEIKTVAEEKNITVAGLPTWQYFETIDQKLLDNCNVQIFSSGFINYSNELVEKFRKLYRDKFNSEPNELAYQGYDALYFVGKNLLKFGKRFINYDKFIEVDGIYSEYDIDVDAKENKVIHVFQPTKDSEIDLFKKTKKK